MNATVQIVAFAVLAAASPVTLLATLVVLGTERGRLNGVFFAGGFILGQAIGLGVPLFVGVAVTSKTSQNGTITASLELAVGVLMVLGAYRLRRPKRDRPMRTESRAAAVLSRLEHVEPKTAFTLGIPLGIGAKRLLISILAASTIAISFAGRVAELNVGATYVVIASVPVWLPVATYVVVGPRGDEWVRVSKAWLLANQREVTFYLALGFGLLFVVGGIVGLVD